MVKTWLSPKLRVLAFMTAVNAAWMAAAWLFFDRPTWLWITPIALSINGLLLTYDQVLSLTRMRGDQLLGQDPWGVLSLVHELSDKFDLPEPKVFLIPHPAAQIFCYAKSKRDNRLYLTEGTLKLLSPAEFRAVMIYQMCAIHSQFNILNYWLGTTVDLFHRLGLALERGFAFTFGWTPRLRAWIVSPWIWFLNLALVSPRDYEALDRATARHLENPEDLARALWKMEAYAHTQPWTDSWVFAHMCMVSPLARGPLTAGLRVQPAIQTRVQELAGRYPL